MNIASIVQKYSTISKHSNYQILPDKLVELLNIKFEPAKSRYENERMSFILNNLDLNGKQILDIGGNTGFFTFESIYNGAASVTYFEGNQEHCDFVREISQFYQYPIEIINSYFDFVTYANKTYDVIYLLNVLHHIGDDFNRADLSRAEALSMITRHLTSLCAHTRYLVFQMGFNQHGNIAKPLFAAGTKQEMIDYVHNAVEGNWEIIEVGIPELKNGFIIYNAPNAYNIKRNDSLGEFLNRPLFILKSKSF